tara:strand:+ start:1241 stop:1597 length:357 start_codon:yes stop_codon:yes gene_type:complete
MSEQFNSFSSPIKKEVVEQIEQLNLSTLQKLHLKLLSHCLEIFKVISNQAKVDFPTEKLLREWCQKESNKLDDKDFSILLYKQMDAAGQKILDYSQEIGKPPFELTLEDLIKLTSLEA